MEMTYKYLVFLFDQFFLLFRLYFAFNNCTTKSTKLTSGQMRRNYSDRYSNHYQIEVNKSWRWRKMNYKQLN